MGVASQNYTLLCAVATSPVSLPLSSTGDVWPRLPLLPSTRHESPPTLRDRLNPHLSLQRHRFPVPVMPNARMSLCTQSVHSFSFPPRPLRTAPSKFPNMIRFGSRPPLIRMGVPAHQSLLVRNVVSMLSHPVISRTRLYSHQQVSPRHATPGFCLRSPSIWSPPSWLLARPLSIPKMP